MHKDYKRLKSFLQQQEFCHSIKVTGARDKRVTSRFEVFGDGKLLHQRTTMDGGMCRTEKEKEALVKKINELLIEQR